MQYMIFLLVFVAKCTYVLREREGEREREREGEREREVRCIQRESLFGEAYRSWDLLIYRC